MKLIYLDYNATTPVAPSVIESMLPFLQEHYGNPSSSHWLGRACQEAIEDARSAVASLLGADREEIYFTSGGTESNNLAIKGVATYGLPVAAGHLVVSSIEHPAVVEPMEYLQQLGFTVTVVPSDAHGVVRPEQVEAAIQSDTILVSIMHANNEIGVIQPLKEISDVCRSAEVLLHTDAAQSVGKVSVRVDDLGVDLLTVAGHKMYAPKGVGALYVRRGVAIEPVLHGAGHEGGLRPGTENVASIVALGRAARMVAKGYEEAGDRMAFLRDQIQNKITKALGENASVNGEKASRLPNTLSINFHEVAGKELLKR
ncbi:MAG: cysteine desulfurase, partial [bacterium]|nr:cysteine desulfurase [bacterium]